ncbi:acyl-CoA-binding protein (ACBP)/diazepam binding inhibitor (DBI)/endozepine (EP) [Coemansia erecta]|uniref:Acyl-CoA-binding protein (ACBP)/diazepam binding inhibitor (DBI)/endozepine (EP) n=1 Tax=Coemansia asiatica TaxID=1052880 RepID=A0A9W7XF87_9FUNG|nr:acyl-CoA-binding protein (ACBP)/diazepam binding inhibitor (DBI)/endozepine (EP) [Coemansia asiatica]KAJ2842473.1 acyl-CoA-binding protein (ACBP)/diazepam binding inhibitor (DBI)/endozepine (EP) [Coemansia erecta]KAJ2873514.1 acyl-CoA-binding protein (ACBP)/diazepam binding inhibitor (DBI)/endozepine (EP) [Coemansia asiatica]
MPADITNSDLKTIYDDASTKDEVKTAIENAVKNDSGHDNDSHQERLAVFLKASKEVTDLPTAPSNEIKLQLYAYYKQGLACALGDAPGMFDFTAKAKYNAWKKVCDEGVTPDVAQQKYIDLVRELQAAE